MTALQKEQIKNLRLQGYGYMKIGQMLGISKNTVHAFCRRNELAGEKSKGTVLCQQCGRPIKIIPKQKPRKFCSDNCRTIWWNTHLDKVNKKALYDFTCVSCGKSFTAYGNKNRKYCCHSCYITHRFKQDGDLSG
jgi:uncharacterized protein YjcR